MINGSLVTQPSTGFDIFRIDEQHSHHGRACCQFVPKHILDDLLMFNGESVDTDDFVPTHFGVLPTEPRPQRIINIEPTEHMMRVIRISASTLPRHALPSLAPHMLGALAQPQPGPNFEVYDLDGATDWPNKSRIPEYKAAISKSDPLPLPVESWPQNAKNAHFTTSKVYEFYKTNFNRDSIDGNGMDIISAVRLRTWVTDQQGKPIQRTPENNAFWDGAVMAYGEGDGMIFSDFTASQDVIGHELTHGVTEHTCGLAYENQSGALNEHISDVFGAIFRQWLKGEKDPTKANWLIGDDCISEDFKKMVKVRNFGHWNALRSMSEPGNAYDVKKGNSAGKDSQPSHMNNYKNLPNTQRGDNGGVHINSGIPNKAFHVFATSIEGPAWDKPGKIWYKTIVDADFGEIQQNGRIATFSQFRDANVKAAKELFPEESEKLVSAWAAVGL